MDTIIATAAEEEAVGIVISRGSRAEAEPQFSWYVWGPPGPDMETETRAA